MSVRADDKPEAQNAQRWALHRFAMKFEEPKPEELDETCKEGAKPRNKKKLQKSLKQNNSEKLLNSKELKKNNLNKTK